MKRILICIVAAGLGVCPPALAQEIEAGDSSLERTVQLVLDPSAVVVLPVEPLSADPKYSDLAAAIYDELLSQLAAIEGIYIVDPELVEPYAASSLDPAEIARHLGAATVLQSGVHAEARGYGIRMKCIDAQTGKQHFSSGSRSYWDWEPQSGTDDKIRDLISYAAESVEESIFSNRQPDFQQESVKATATILDTSLSVAQRLEALNKLPRGQMAGFPHQYTDGGAALSGEVAIAAAQLASESQDPSVKISIWRIMAGVADSSLVQPLVHSLNSDKDAGVRKEAAKALAVHLDEPGVWDALEMAAAHDPDSHVRSAAHFTMSSPEDRREVLRTTAMDVSLPEQERRTAMFKLWYHFGYDDPMPADEELTAAMVNLAKTAKDPKTRGSVWSSMGRMGGSEIVKPLIEALSEEPSETVRESVVGSLLKVIDEPGVREALASAQSKDTSPLVRQAAERVLGGAEW